MEFRAEEFLSEKVSREEVEVLKKEELLKLAEYLKIKVTKQTSRVQVKAEVSEKLEKEGLLSETEVGQRMVNNNMREMTDREYELEMKRLEMQERERREEREMREREKEREMQERKEERELKLLELKMKERELQLAFEKEIKIAELQQRTGRQESEGKEAVRNIKLVPKFNEKDVEKFFLHFEKLAESMEWSKSIWTVLLQSVLIGKAQEVYSALSVEQSTDYDVVKNTIMQAYELVPEAYRQKFRSRQKGIGETYVEFAREKETLFDIGGAVQRKWVRIITNWREVMLLEEFKNSVRREVKTHLEEQKVDTLRKAAKMADEYELTHKEEFVKKRENPYSREAQRSVGYNPRMESKYYSNRAKVETGETKMKSKSEGKVEHNERKEQKAFQGPTCYHCKKKGHVMSDCWFLKKADSKRATVNLVGRKASVEVKGLQESSGQKETGRGNTRCFESFMSRGIIKNKKKDGGEKSVVILRDTGASQTLMSSSVLQVREKASENDSVLIKGVGGDYKPVPLQKVYLKSDLVTGPVEVGIVSEIPVEGVDMVLGNDLAGDRVKADPHMCKEPSIEKEDSDKKSQDGQGTDQACVVTRSKKLKAKQETSEGKNEMGVENTLMNRDDRCQSDDELKRSEDCEKDDGEIEETKTVQSQEGKESDDESQRSEDFEKDGDEIEETKAVKNREGKVAQENLKRSQQKMKEQDDKGAKERQLRTGDRVLILLPVPGEPLRAKFCGLYEVERKVDDLNYVVSTPDRRKTKRLCHINMLKQYFERQDKAQVASVQRYCENANTDQSEAKDNQMEGEEDGNKEFERDMKLHNSDVLRNVHLKLSHLETKKQKRKFFERLRQANLVINLEKSELAQDYIEYLGHEVGQGSVKKKKEKKRKREKKKKAKVQAIAKYPEPKDKKALMRFLGMAGYYRKFCRNFSNVVNPLTNLMKKGVKFHWDMNCQNAFDKVKAMLMNAPVLSAPQFEKPFKIMIDASDVGVGAVLLQTDERGLEHPVCYYSKKLNKHQQRYSTIEKEGLGLVLALQQFEVYINSGKHEIEVFTDHNPLTFLGRMKNNNQRILRWSLLLQEYNIVIKHVPGRENVIADALSRI